MVLISILSVLNLLYFTLVLSEVRVRCPVWMFSVVHWCHAFEVCCSDVFLMIFGIIKLLLMLFPPSSCYLLSLIPIYSPPHPVSEHSACIHPILPLLWKAKFHQLNFFLCLIKYRLFKPYWGVEVNSIQSKPNAGAWWVTLRAAWFPEEEPPVGIGWESGWPRWWCERCGEDKNFCLCLELNTEFSVVWL